MADHLMDTDTSKTFTTPPTPQTRAKMKSPRWLKAIWKTKGEEGEVAEVEIPLWEPPEGTSPRPTSISSTNYGCVIGFN